MLEQINDPLPEFIIKFNFINETLIEFGWFISPHLIGREFEKIFKLCERINIDKEFSTFEILKTQSEINELLTPIVFNPLTRAFFIYRSKELKHLKRFSHHIEKALLHYLRNDYFSAIHCLLPAIEGVMLSYSNWKYGDSRKPSIDLLIKELEKCRVRTVYPERYKMYSKTLCLFLRNWIFSDTSTSNANFSFLNRHYILHGMGNENYYSLADCQRIIIFFDLLTEFLSLEENKEYVFIPENSIQINARQTYYELLMTKDLKKNFMEIFERQFMKENSNYTEEKNPPDWNLISAKAIIENIDFFNSLESLKNRKFKYPSWVVNLMKRKMQNGL